MLASKVRWRRRARAERDRERAAQSQAHDARQTQAIFAATKLAGNETYEHFVVETEQFNKEMHKDEECECSKTDKNHESYQEANEDATIGRQNDTIEDDKVEENIEDKQKEMEKRDILFHSLTSQCRVM